MKSIFPFNLQKPLDIHRVKKKKKKKKNQRRNKEEKEKKKNLKSDRLISSQTKDSRRYPILYHVLLLPTISISPLCYNACPLKKKNEGKERGGRDEVGRPFWTFPFPRIDEIVWRNEDRREEGEREKKVMGIKKKEGGGKRRGGLENVGKRTSRRGSHEKRAERRTD